MSAGPSLGDRFWILVADVWNVAERASTGKLTERDRLMIVAECQAQVRKAGGSIDDQRLCNDELSRMVAEHNARQEGAGTSFLKSLAVPVAAGAVVLFGWVLIRGR